MIKLSASRLNTFNGCSYQYYCKYILKLPDEGNAGMWRGSVCHDVLECLIPDRRRKYVEQILKTKNAFSVKSIERLATIHAKKYGINDPENISMIKDFLLVALSFDFYCEGCLNLKSEEFFDFKTENYNIIGYVDVTAEYPDRILVRDFKTSKRKFAGEDLQFNVQALIYALVQKKRFPHLPVEVEFLFLKMPRAPQQKITLNDEMISGFEDWLTYMSDYLEDFDYKKALSNLPNNDPNKKRKLCGESLGEFKVNGDPAHICAMKYPFAYFAAISPGGEVIKTSKVKKELDNYREKGYNVVEKSYNGCPAFSHLYK